MPPFGLLLLLQLQLLDSLAEGEAVALRDVALVCSSLSSKVFRFRSNKGRDGVGASRRWVGGVGQLGELGTRPCCQLGCSRTGAAVGDVGVLGSWEVLTGETWLHPRFFRS